MSRGPGVALALPVTASGRPILTRADLEAYDPSFTHSGGRERFYCPIHGGDHQRSLSLNPETGQYVCHTGSCQARGTLKDFWPADPGQRPPRRVIPSFEQHGRTLLAAKRRGEQERAARFTEDMPPAAAAFLAQLDKMNQALRDPDCPGAAYLRQRGLDPDVAAALGAGYARPNAWPGDYGRKVGRIVYPLADPLTGRIVSACGRLCDDPDATWTAEQHDLFKKVKQRKLKDCPAGIWPYVSISEAHTVGCPLVVVEGPADVVALAQRADVPLQVMALIGTASEMLPAAAVQGLPGVVVALDADEAGRKGALSLRADLAIAGIRVEAPASGWLGSMKDTGELAAKALESPDADERYTQAVAQVATACFQFQEALPITATHSTPAAAPPQRYGAPASRLPSGAGIISETIPTAPCPRCGNRRWQLLVCPPVGEEGPWRWACVVCQPHLDPRR